MPNDMMNDIAFTVEGEVIEITPPKQPKTANPLLFLLMLCVGVYIFKKLK